MIRLSPEEIAFFRDEGYVIKHKVMNEDLMARARKRMWENAPPELDPNDADTWIGPINDYREGEEGTPMAVGSMGEHIENFGSKYTWKYRTIGTEGWIVRMLLTDPSIWGMAEQLLGKDRIAAPERMRGIYCRLPEENAPDQPLGCHTDGHAFHLGVAGYIDDVPPNGGGFSVWPRSHRVFYYQHVTHYGSEQTAGHAEHLARFKRQAPTECHGEAGDIVFWHHRLAHAGSPRNRSKVIRKAVMGDLERKDLRQHLAEPPCEDMWRDWPGISPDGQ